MSEKRGDRGSLSLFKEGAAERARCPPRRHVAGGRASEGCRQGSAGARLPAKRRQPLNQSLAKSPAEGGYAARRLAGAASSHRRGLASGVGAAQARGGVDMGGGRGDRQSSPMSSAARSPAPSHAPRPSGRPACRPSLVERSRQKPRVRSHAPITSAACHRRSPSPASPACPPPRARTGAEVLRPVGPVPRARAGRGGRLGAAGNDDSRHLLLCRAGLHRHAGTGHGAERRGQHGCEEGGSGGEVLGL